MAGREYARLEQLNELVDQQRLSGEDHARDDGIQAERDERHHALGEENPSSGCANAAGMRDPSRRPAREDRPQITAAMIATPKQMAVP